jgi:hypothetical protein
MTSKPGWHHDPGMSLEDTRLLSRWCPAHRQHDPGSGFRMEHVKACPDTAAGVMGGERENLKRQEPQGAEHTDLPWVVLYVRRWLEAPLQQPDGTLQQRDRGTPQGSAVK